MSKNLIIVESPAKVKTITKFLGKDYQVVASYGHLIDLKKSELSVDIENNFEPTYITIRGKGSILSSLKSKVKSSENVYLATDPDREGETISYLLMNKGMVKELKGKNIYRISFNEITENAIKEALANPRPLNMGLVDAGIARRIMDRVVGYKLSPILWAKIKGKLSAGRVQSVALNMIAEKEKEILDFNKQEYWSLDAKVFKGREKFDLKYVCGKMDLDSKEAVEKIINEISGSKAKIVENVDAADDSKQPKFKVENLDNKVEFKITDVKLGERTKKAPYPFTTSTMQQEANKFLNFSTSKTMSVAQKLYEGVEIEGRGTVGLITYLRTDSTRIADVAKAAANKYIEDNYGKEYVNPSDNEIKKSGTKIQDAHEAIRPTYFDLNPASVKDSLSRDEFRLYELIWKRFFASRMMPAIYETKSVKFDANGKVFSLSGSSIKFRGFLNVYNNEEKDEKNVNLPKLNVGDVFNLDTFVPEQHFTEPPAHFTESTLVKALEEEGIGRPSTYAPTITVLLKRHYITKEKKSLFITELGVAVNNMIKTSFPDIVDKTFTRRLEEDLDMVEEEKKDWHSIFHEFYPHFNEEVERALAEVEKIEIRDEESDIVCEKCGRKMVIKYGPNGKFLACPGFPECRNTKPYIEKTGFKCPECGGEVIKLRTKKGRIFYSCENRTPDGEEGCKYITWKLPEEAKVVDKAS